MKNGLYDLFIVGKLFFNLYIIILLDVFIFCDINCHSSTLLKRFESWITLELLIKLIFSIHLLVCRNTKLSPKILRCIKDFA